MHAHTHTYTRTHTQHLIFPLKVQQFYSRKELICTSDTSLELLPCGSLALFFLQAVVAHLWSSSWIWLAVVFYLSHKLFFNGYNFKITTSQHRQFSCLAHWTACFSWKLKRPADTGLHSHMPTIGHVLLFATVLTIPYCLHDLKVTSICHLASCLYCFFYFCR